MCHIIEVIAARFAGLSKQKAEELLDWLEDQGCTQLSVTLEEGGFAVRWLCPHGLHLVQQEGGDLQLRRPDPCESPGS
jgi:hypothetical protein